MGQDGALYGSTSIFGQNGVLIEPTLFRITTAGSFTTLYTFTGVNDEGPYGPPVQDADGNFYNLDGTGGANSAGYIFKFNASGQFTDLYDCVGAGSANYSPCQAVLSMLQGSDGNFYFTPPDSSSGYDLDSWVPGSAPQIVYQCFSGSGQSGDCPSMEALLAT